MAAVAALSDVAPDRCIGEPDKFALEEIRRGAAATGRNGAHGPAATRIALTLESRPRHRPKTTAHRDLAYARDRHVRQNLNLVLPKKSAAPFPLVSWVHRGGW